MNAKGYIDKPRFQLGAVELVQKAKQCGKENCAQCPHKGYWYARIGSYSAKAGRSAEIYLGRDWTDADLRKVVAPLLCDKEAALFVKLLDRQVTQEHIAFLIEKRKDLAVDLARMTNDYKRRVHLLEVDDRNAARTIGECQKRLKAWGKMN